MKEHEVQEILGGLLVLKDMAKELSITVNELFTVCQETITAVQPKE